LQGRGRGEKTGGGGTGRRKGFCPGPVKWQTPNGGREIPMKQELNEPERPIGEGKPSRRKEVFGRVRNFTHGGKNIP